MKAGGYGFTEQSVSVPVSVSEFSAAGRDYPIVFAANNAAPIVLLGLKDKNLSIADGQWDEALYIPAYIRRYPFGAVRVDETSEPVMMIDAASERVVQADAQSPSDEGMALFDDRQPSDFLKKMLSFCEQFHNDAMRTLAFSEALKEADLLVDRRADVTLPNEGGKLGVAGFQVIDPERFSNLDDARVLDWHRKGWLGLIHLHLTSLERFQSLMRRQSRLG